ncbi:hypothetical protein BDQ12DRAFT_715271 [Crucibulum laeve]|uniref:Uncharacterized protein n=1 Tax=Crucibulum laeve TaxID=68775 RepID=A0A5C3LQ47_9AGAR|nr:hypothetical protein BDQ12DRAFT_715271 [Crucibulum laeve]
MSSQHQATAVRPSTAIQYGAELLYALIENERTNIENFYQQKFHELETRFSQLHQPTESGYTTVTRIHDLENQLAEAKEDATKARLEALEARQVSSVTKAEATRWESEFEKLRSLLGGIGMVYEEDSIKFKGESARAVAEVISNARKQMSTSGVDIDEHLEMASDPLEFLAVFRVLLERDRLTIEHLQSTCKELESRLDEKRRNELISFDERVQILKQRLGGPNSPLPAEALQGLERASAAQNGFNLDGTLIRNDAEG